MVEKATVLIWIDKATKQYFEMPVEPGQNDLINFDFTEVEIEKFNEFEKIRAQQGKFVTFEEGKFKVNEIKVTREETINRIKKELYEIRLEYDIAPFEFEVDGEIYLQNNRSIDQSNLTRIVVMCQALKKTSFENWKFYTKDNSEKYVNLSLKKMMEMALIMQEQTTKSMATETLLSHKLDTLTDEELKAYDARIEYDKAYKSME